METDYFHTLTEQRISWLPSTRDKKPALSSYKEYFTTAPNEQNYKEWLEGIQDRKYDGIQIINGKISKGLFTIDFDSKDENLIRAILDKDLNNLKAETWVSSTPHGFHVHFFADKNTATKSIQFSNLKVDVKGEKSLSKEFPSENYTNLSEPNNIRTLSKEETDSIVAKLEIINSKWNYIGPVIENWVSGHRQLLALGFIAFLRKKLSLNIKDATYIISFIAKYKNDEEAWQRLQAIQQTFAKQIDETAIHSWFDQAALEEVDKKLYSLLPTTTASSENEQSKRDKRINDFIEDFLHNHNVIAMPNSHDLYIYDDESGIWRNGEDILFKEAANQLSDSLTKNSLSDILLRIQGRTLIDNDKFNKQHKIGLLNGALDLETGEIIEPRPEFYITKQIQVKYDPNASPDKILKFIWDIAKPSAKKFLRLLEIAAWPLLPGYPIQKAIVLIGDGYNGKSTFLSLLRKFYGDKNVSTLTLQDLSKDFLKAELYNKVANISPDLPSSSISDTGDFKWATGGSDVKTAQRKYKTAISFLNEAKMYFSANQMPKVSEDTKAFYRRFDFIELENDFSQSDNPNLLNEITTEDQLSGLLNLILKIFWPILRKNLRFSFSDSIEETAKKYAVNSNTPKLFFETCINYDDSSEDWIGATDLYNTYIEWCEKNGLIKVSQTAFGREMKYSIQRTGRRDGRMVYLGITLKDLDIPVNPKGSKENEGDVAEVIKNYLQVNELDTQFTQFTQFWPYCYFHGQEEEKEEKEIEIDKQIGKNPVNPVNPVNDTNEINENDTFPEIGEPI